jgi:hypothetical protein
MFILSQQKAIMENAQNKPLYAKAHDKIMAYKNYTVLSTLDLIIKADVSINIFVLITFGICGLCVSNRIATRIITSKHPKFFSTKLH